MSQMQVALASDVSTRHLSFIETGRARPSPDVIVRLSETLHVPLRARNALFLAAGFAPLYPEQELGSPDLALARGAIERLIMAHDPYPGMAVDGRWNIAISNLAARRMIAALPLPLTQPSANLFRIGLHPEGLASFTTNFQEWGAYLLGELERLVSVTCDAAFEALLDEVCAYSTVRSLQRAGTGVLAHETRLLVPCQLALGCGTLSLFSALVTFGSPRNVTLAELTVELFYPADDATALALRAKAG